MPFIKPVDPVDREVGYMPTKAPYDPRWMLAGRQSPSMCSISYKLYSVASPSLLSSSFSCRKLPLHSVIIHLCNLSSNFYLWNISSKDLTAVIALIFPSLLFESYFSEPLISTPWCLLLVHVHFKTLCFYWYVIAFIQNYFPSTWYIFCKILCYS